MFSQPAQTVGVFGQTGRKELASVADGGRTANKVSEASTNLETYGRVRTVPHGIYQSPRTASIMMVSWPGRCRITCSRTSVGSSLRRGVDADMGLRAEGDLTRGDARSRRLEISSSSPTLVLAPTPSEKCSRKRQNTGKHLSSKSKSQLVALEGDGGS